MGWLDRFPARKPATDPQALASVLPLDEEESGAETGKVTAVLFYRDATSEWPVVTEADPRAWLSVEAWPSWFVDVSVGHFWPVDRIIKQDPSR